MPRFSYIAKSDPKKKSQGSIEAESKQEAINKLTQMGFFPISVESEAVSLGSRTFFSFQRVTKSDVVLFTRQLATLIESGVNILVALNIIRDQTANRHLEAVLHDIAGRIKDGKSFSESLSAFPHLFSQLYCSMIRTGEASGDLNYVLKRLADFLEAQEEFRNSVRASLTYPFFVFTVSVITVVILLVFVMPRLVVTLRDMGQVLPLPTRILINTSNFLRDYWWLVIVVVSLAVFLLRRIILSPKGKVSWDRIKLRIFLFGPIILKSQISRLVRTLSLLLSSGQSIVPALDISISVVENEILKAEVAGFKEQIISGSSLSEALKKSPFFPAFVTNIIAIGEESGSLDKSLLRIAQDYETEVNRTVVGFTKLLEPVIILIMGLIVGFIVLSMLLPIFQINLIVR
jgi:general secretion pathway protein F